MNEPDPDPDFQIEAELLEAVPRRVVSTKGTFLAWRIGWNLLLAIVCIVYLLGSGEMNDLEDLATHGRVIDGYVVAARRLNVKSPEIGCEVAYTLNRNATEPDSTFVLPECTGSLPRTGDAFKVTCLPKAPGIHRIGNVGADTLEDCRIHWIAVGLWWVIPYLLVMWFVRGFEETRKQLLRRAIAAVATVTGRHETKGAESTSYMLTYGFRLPDGRHRTGLVSVTKNFYEVYPEGRKFSVLVHTADNYNAATPYFSISGAMIRNAPKRSFL